ncbi:hypothetical protein [Butyrivibrio sp. MC2013]|uniref:hypothetical protein n=1 Tax=Butyrivibrio sp. MC2013 TaxID=1280686 RepID=UPI00041D6CC1|nr:hypothetical protein [Butyrivibrio sp. MC2013]
MILKKSGEQYLIWGVFSVFILLLAGLLLLSSGLSLIGNTSGGTAGYLLMAIAVCCLSMLVFFLIYRLMAPFMERITVSEVPLEILYVISFAIISIIYVYYRFTVLQSLGYEIRDGADLYDRALISQGAKAISADSYQKLWYLTGLRWIFTLVGNRQDAALNYQMGLALAASVLFAIAVRLLLGRIASITTMLAFTFLPVFGREICYLDVSVITKLMIAAELVFLAYYVRTVIFDAEPGVALMLLQLFTGIMIGFVTYMDGGNLIMIIIPFICTFSYLRRKISIVGFIRLLVGAAFGFVTAAALLWRGNLISVFMDWADRTFYYGSLSPQIYLDVFSELTRGYELLYLLLLAVLFGALSTFLYNKRTGRLAVWIALAILMLATYPCMNETVFKRPELLIALFSAIAGGGLFTALGLDSKDADLLEEMGDFDEDKDTASFGEEIREIRMEDLEDGYEGETVEERVARQLGVRRNTRPKGIQEVVRPENPLAVKVKEHLPLNDAYDDSAKESDSHNDELPSYDPLYEEPLLTVAASKEKEYTPETDKAAREPASETGETESVNVEIADKGSRFVPKGMFVPLENEYDTEEAHAESAELKKRRENTRKMMEVNGKIKLSEHDGFTTARREKTADFDLPFAPGDDFDLA